MWIDNLGILSGCYISTEFYQSRSLDYVTVLKLIRAWITWKSILLEEIIHKLKYVKLLAWRRREYLVEKIMEVANGEERIMESL